MLLKIFGKKKVKDEKVAQSQTTIEKDTYNLRSIFPSKEIQEKVLKNNNQQ